MAEVVSPELIETYAYMRAHPCVWLSRRDIARALGTSYWIARTRLRRLAEAGLIAEYVAWPPRRIWYHYAPPAPPPPPPPPPPPFIAEEECSGYDIHFDEERRIYLVLHPETKELIREDRKLCIELTASIKTEGGHDPITCEITVTTFVERLDLSSLLKVEREMEKALRDWLIDQRWGTLIHAFEKIGVAYNGETHVKEVGLYPATWWVDYPVAHVFLERKSYYIPLRSYEGEFRI